MESNPLKKLAIDLSALRRGSEPKDSSDIDEAESPAENSTFPRRRRMLSRPSLSNLWDLSPDIRSDINPPEIRIEPPPPTVQTNLGVRFSSTDDDVQIIPRRLERSNSLVEISSRTREGSDDMTASKRGSTQLRKSPSFASAVLAPMRKLSSKFGNRNSGVDTPDSGEDDDNEETITAPPVVSSNRRDGRVFEHPPLALMVSNDDVFTSSHPNRRRQVTSAPVLMMRKKRHVYLHVGRQPNSVEDDTNKCTQHKQLDIISHKFSHCFGIALVLVKQKYCNIMHHDYRYSHVGMFLVYLLCHSRLRSH